MVDTLKNFMSSMTDTIKQQVSEQVKKAVEATSSVRPLPRFEFVPLHAPMVSHHHSEGMKEATHADRNDQSRAENLDQSISPRPYTAAARAMDGQQSQPRPQRRTQSTPEELPGSRSRSRPGGLRGRPQGNDEPQNVAPTVTNSLTTAECQELRKAIPEPAYKGQVNLFLKRGGCFLREEHEPGWAEPQDEECSTEMVDTIAGGYVLTVEEGIQVPLCFGDKAKARTLEVDFLVVNVPTTYNIILRRPTLHKVEVVIAPCLLQLQFEADAGSTGKKYEHQWRAKWPKIRITKSKQKHPAALGVGIFVMVAALVSLPTLLGVVASPSRGIISSLFRPSSPVVGGINSTNSGSRPQPRSYGDPLYIGCTLQSSPLCRRPGCQSRQELPKELGTFLTSPPVALVLIPGRPFLLSLHPGVGFLQLALQASFSFFSFSKRRLYLATASLDFWRSARRSPIFPNKRASELSRSWIHFSRAETDSFDLATFSPPGKGLESTPTWSAKEEQP
ncbi:hypothetical protein Cgig2_025019 [Carnegiea gigantea]|uniref:Uncharacterized protein n=1 Tax=Carnegiea gigantea TaxID=171969 RepID=A0A9Q1QA45_9CARY|nr:hypothetical protein Cgig2_025019 [Carnegiea gigantea]